MPKVLNVVKLHKKFASLTRSKESIQSLAGWIIHHKEFHEDIVNEWLVGLSKDYNALVMFYVANEVIQNCGKKRVPEFREDFAKILKKAVSLEKVKEIKENVIRLMSFWRERDIYDEKFSQELQSILNSQEIKVDPEPEPTEEEVIARFKKEKIFANLEMLKTAVADREEKEEILNFADEPVKPDSSVSLVQKECQDMIEKCEKYIKLVEETINLTCKEVRVKKVVLEDLKDCCVFYSAQSRDVKEVANMFRIYGRKLKIMEKKISEKKSSLENTEPNFSPSFPEAISNSPNSVSSYVSFSDNDSTSVLERMSKVSQDSPVLSSHETNSEMEKSFFALLNHDKTESLVSEGLIPDPGIEKLEGNSLNSEDAIKEEQCNLTQDKPKPGSNKDGDLNDIDFLLDESYDCKKGNPKPMLKRKAEIRLKLKEKRVCTENISESSNPKTSDEPFKIGCDENIMKSLRGYSSNMNITEKEKDANLELSTNGVKGNDNVLSESLLDKNKTVLNNELSNKKDDAIENVVILEAPLQKSQIIDELSNKKADKDDGVMILEGPLQKDKTVLNDVPPSKKVDEDDCVMILDAPLPDKSVLNDTPSNVKADESDSGMILKAPLVEDKTVLNVEHPSEKADKDSLILHTSTGPHLNLSDRSKDGFESTELEGKISSTTQKELASDSISIEKNPDDDIPNADKMKPKLSFENCVVPAKTSHCCEPQGIQTESDSDTIPKTRKVPKDELNGETPNLLGNLQKVLECICNDQIMDLKTSNSEKEPFLPLENYIAIYGALCCPDPVVKHLTEASVSPPLQAAGSVFRQNEVVDMECETDEES